MINLTQGRLFMDIKKFLKNILFFGSVYYTSIATVLILIVTCLPGDNATLIETDRFLLILLFSFMMGLGSAILRAEIMSRTAASLTHAACYIIGFLLFVALSGAGFSSSVIFTLVFSIVYVVITIIARCALKAKSSTACTSAKKPAKEAKSKKEKSTYTNQFLK